MAVESFYSSNLYRSYPFKADQPWDGSTLDSVRRLPEESIVDVHVTTGWDISFEDHPQLKLVSVGTGTISESESASWETSSTVEFMFQVGDDVNDIITFEVPTDTAIYGRIRATEYYSYDDSRAGQTPANNVSPRFKGVLVVGKLDELSTLLSSVGSLDSDSLIVEPSLMRVTTDQHVDSMVFWNRGPTIVGASQNCGSDLKTQSAGCLSPRVATDAFDATNLDTAMVTGDVAFKADRNMSVLQNTSENSITFRAEVGTGSDDVSGIQAAPLTNTVTRFGVVASDPTAACSLTYADGTWQTIGYSDGTPCGMCLVDIAGAGGPNVTIKGGPGVEVTPVYNADGTGVLYIDLVGGTEELCIPITESESESI